MQAWSTQSVACPGLGEEKVAAVLRSLSEHTLRPQALPAAHTGPHLPSPVKFVAKKCSQFRAKATTSSCCCEGKSASRETPQVVDLFIPLRKCGPEKAMWRLPVASLVTWVHALSWVELCLTPILSQKKKKKKRC